VISLASTTPDDAPTLLNLFQLYTHDFSEYWAGQTRGDVQPDGRFADYPLESYWRRPAWDARLIRRGDALAGFVLINDSAHSRRPVASSVAEFFILRKYRGAGAGRIAAEATFSLRPGGWEVAVARKNVRAAGFWLRTIKDSPRASGLEQLDMSDGHWDGPIYRFDWA